ncbi:MAG: asparagine synthase (glutamine-hydrolyzing) [Gammaproteobacteria bacterium]
MCGITGIAAMPGVPVPSLDQLKAMCNTLVHRGPDAEGVGIQDGVGLAMRRLAIIDVRGGSQPVFNEDRTIRTIFNGEIYNFRELRRSLQRSGHRFTTNTDTEVIVHAYEEYGEKFVEQFNGMFAFALHDSVGKKLILARDHIGVKPLYYAVAKGHLIWGSEIKALLASGLLEKELDINALGEFLAWEYVPGKRTLFTNVRKLEPGHLMVFDLRSGEYRISIYWDIPDDRERQNVPDDEWTALVEDKISECVRRQLVSDVPLGAFLSGGVDSSLVVASMGEAKTFSIGFTDPSYNELSYARRVAAHLGVQHSYEIIDPYVVDLFERLMHFMDDPIGDFSIFPTFLISRLARHEVTVALSGDGGDELFGGYETYVADQRARYYRYFPTALRRKLLEPWIRSLRPRPEKKGAVNKLKRFMEGLEQPSTLAHTRWRVFAGEAIRRCLFNDDVREEITVPVEDHITRLYAQAGDREMLNRSLYVDVKSYLVDNCLVKVDRMSMAMSLETRVPLLDRELVELSFRVPCHLKVNSGATKILLKQIAERHVPRDCVYRPKEGFSIPIKNWLGSQFRHVMENALNPERIRNEGLFKPETITRLKEEHLSGRANHSHILWSLIVFQSWRSMWYEG